MKNNKSNYVTKIFFTLLCAITLNFDGVCMEEPNTFYQDMLSTNGRKVISASLNFSSSVLGLVASWETLNGESSEGVKIANACTSLGAAALKSYNWYIDWKDDGIRGVPHQILNVLSLGCNITSATLSIMSAASDDPYQKNLYNFVSSVTNVSGLFLKGIDLFLTPSPD